MNVQNEIEQLTISFFKTINSKITEDNGVYQITIPENYQIYFQKSQLSITFDEQIASEQDCELIIPGNKITVVHSSYYKNLTTTLSCSTKTIRY